MERYGLVRLEKGDRGRVVPHVPYSEILLDVPIKAFNQKDRDARVFRVAARISGSPADSGGDR